MTESDARLYCGARATRVAGYGRTLIEAGFAQEWDRLLALVPREEALADPFIANIYAAALIATSRSDDCISFLRDAVDRHPEYSGLLIRLGNLVLGRSMKPGTTSRVQDQRLASDLAERARDLRRSWRGSGAEAVELACRASLLGRRLSARTRAGLGGS